MSICAFLYDKVEVTRTIRMRSLEISCDKISWQVTQYFVTVKKYRLVCTSNGQLSTRTRVILHARSGRYGRKVVAGRAGHTSYHYCHA